MPVRSKRKHSDVGGSSSSSIPSSAPADDDSVVQQLLGQLSYTSLADKCVRFHRPKTLEINKLQAQVVVDGLRALKDKYDAIDAEQLSYYLDNSGSQDLSSAGVMDPTLQRLQYTPMIKLLETKDYIGYEDVVKCSTLEAHRATHGMSDSVRDRRGWRRSYAPFYHNCNLNRVAYDYLTGNAEDLMGGVPFGTADFDFTPEQRLEIGMLATSGFPEEVTTRVRHSYVTQHEDHSGVIMEAFTHPEFQLVNNSTGAGKTAVLIASMMLVPCCPKRWKQVVDATPARLRRQLRRSHLGLITDASHDNMQVARVSIAFVPEIMTNHWEQTAHSVREGMRRDLGLDFEIWVGLKQHVKGTVKRAGVEKSLGLAHALGKPLLWIVKAEPASANKTIRSNPELGYYARLFDEMNKSTEKRSAAPESIPVLTKVAAANPDRLEGATDYQARHPVRLGLGGDKYSTRNIEHAAIFKQASIPCILRELVCQGIGRTMPKGLHVHRVKVRSGTLSGRLLKSDLNFQTMRQVLEELLTTAGCHPTTDAFPRMLNEVEVVLAPRADNEPVQTRLDRALTQTDGMIAELTPQVVQTNGAGLAGSAPHDHPELSAYKALGRVLTKLRDKLFGRLGEDGEVPTDPITFEEIDSADIQILFCCTQIISKQSLDEIRKHGQKCPLCRQSNPISFNMNSTLDDISKQKPVAAACKPCNKPGAASTSADWGMSDASSASDMDEDEPESEPGPDRSEARLNAFFQELDESQEQFSSSLTPITKIINAQLDHKPNSRILVAYYMHHGGYGVANNEYQSTLRTGELIHADCPRLESCEGLGKKNASTMERFESPHGGARVLLINLAETSDSLVGINLGKADLLIMKQWGSNISGSTLEQLQGRIMRPQAESRQVGRFTTVVGGRLANTPMQSSFPAKRIVMLSKRD